mgnify:CR=1 FL=1
MKIAIAQINPTVGDIEGNYSKIVSRIEKGKNEGAKLVVFPELVMTGYPPKDLLQKKSFVQKNISAIYKLAEKSEGITAVVGFVNKVNNKLYNAAALINNGKLIGTYHKIHLPNYDVFDEKRYFKPGNGTPVFELEGKKIGITICEDLWTDKGLIKKLKAKGADFIVNISASPFHHSKYIDREELLKKRCLDNKVSIVYTNLVGGQDDLVFDGRSYFFDQEGNKIVQAKSFTEDFVMFDTLEEKVEQKFYQESETEEIHHALVLGLKDYVHKNGFSKVVVGLSGGIDSALTAALAVDALGKENVLGVTMPSHFSSKGSVDDSLQLADNLGIKCEIISIKDSYDAYCRSLEKQFAGTQPNVAEENIQARIRGNMLMAISNKHGHMVLATGNKSEGSVGYATLYGDMSGGLAVLSDVFKTKVYEISNNINIKAGKEIIPVSTITKEPSAELSADQKDSDSLPAYEILDPILQSYVENDQSREEITAQGFSMEIVDKIIRMVDRNEYKRQQSAPGIKITPRAFGSGRRMPITNRWKENE